MPSINHVWFDFSDTIAGVNDEIHDGIKYSAFAELSGHEDTPENREKYRQLYLKHGRSNANVFSKEFGKPNKFWSDLIGQHAANGLYELTEPAIPDILMRLSKLTPISVFSNVDTKDVLRSFGIDTEIFEHILSSSELTHPKPHQEGYLKLIELSRLPANQILYIGDIEEKDILPAKAVGLKTGIIWNQSDEADYNFSSFQDILNLIEKDHEA